jgi:hypothetical protein
MTFEKLDAILDILDIFRCLDSNARINFYPNEVVVSGSIYPGKFDTMEWALMRQEGWKYDEGVFKLRIESDGVNDTGRQDSPGTLSK